MNATIQRENLGRAFEEATVGDVMSAGVISCAPETPLRAVARLMSTHRVHAIFVFDYGAEDDETTELWGVVSDLDVVAAGRVADMRTAGTSAVTPLLTIASDEPLERAVELMAASGVSHVAVLDPKSQRPAGVLSTLDVAGVLATR
jgi:CBS domain-containing protein